MLVVATMGGITSWLRSAFNYALLAPFVIAGLCLVMLLANIVASYWYHRRLSILGTAGTRAGGGTKDKPFLSRRLVGAPINVAGAQPHSIGSFGCSPPVRLIPMLDFAQKGGNFRLDSSFFLTKYMHYRWAGGGGNADNSDDEVHSMAKEVANEMAVIQQMPGTEAAIQTLLDLVIRDFIQLWFRTLSADPSFSGSVKAEIASILRHIIARIERFDISRFFMVRVVPILSRHLHEYRKAEKAALRVISLGGKAGGKRPPSMPSAGRNVRRLRSKTLTGITKSSGPDGDEVSMNSLIEDFYSKGRLHSALQRLKTFSESGKYQDSKRPPSEAERAENEKCVISEYLRPIVEDLLPLVMGDGSLGFGPHRIIVREILASTLLTSILRAVSDPDTINKLVDMKLTRLIEEQRMLNKLREALDLQSSPLETPNTLGREGAGGSEPSGGILGRSTRPKVTRTYEEFIDMIKRCQDLEELDSMHGAVVSHIRKKRILIMGQNKDDIVHGEKVRDIIVYINRLYVAKKLIEKRITLLTRASKPSSVLEQTSSMAKPAPRSTNAGYAPHSDIGETVATAAAAAAAATAVTTVEAISARNGDGSIGVGVVGVRRDPSAYLPHTSRQSVYYQQRDNPATISPPLFSLHEILTNVSALSAFAEYMDLVGRRFSLEYWLNIEGLRKMPNDAPTVISPQTINTLWKSYFTLRVDELGASEDTLSAVQKYLKPYRTSGKLDLNLENVDNETLSVAFDLMCRVQADLFSQIEQREYPNFLRSTLYRRFLTSYVLTPYQTQIKNQIFPATTPVHGVDTANDAHSIAESSDSVANPFIAPLSLRSPSSVKNIPIVHYPGPLSQTALSFGDKGDASNASTMMPDPLHRLNSIPEDGGGGDADGDKGKGVGLVKANGDSTIAQPDAGNSGYSYATNLWLELTSSLFGTNGPKGSEGKITGDLDREKQSAGTATGGMGSVSPGPSLSDRAVFSASDIDDTDLIMPHQVEGVEAVLEDMMSRGPKSDIIRKQRLAATTTPKRTASIITSDGALFETPKAIEGGGLPRLKSSKSQPALHRSPTMTAIGGSKRHSYAINHSQSKQTGNSGGSIVNCIDLTTIPRKPPSPQKQQQQQQQEDKNNHGEPDPSSEGDNGATYSKDDEVSLSTDGEGTSDNDDVSSLDIDKAEESGPPVPEIKLPVNTAHPGDLFLSDRIVQLNSLIDRKRQQIAIVDTLLARVNDKQHANEERLLLKSRRELSNEVQRLLEQRRVYERQSRLNTLLPARTIIHIPRTTLAIAEAEPKPLGANPRKASQIGSRMREAINPIRRATMSNSPKLLAAMRRISPGLHPAAEQELKASAKKYVVYMIDILQTDLKGKIVNSWTVSHRYREFDALHKQIKASFPAVAKSNELPTKNPLFKFKKSHIESRRRALEAYLNRLVQHHDVCQSFALRSFLSLLPPLRFEKESEACLSAQLRGSTDSDTSATIPTAPGSGELDERETHGMWMSKLSKTIGSDLNDLAGGDDSILDVITQQLGNQAVQQPAATPSSANRDEIRSDTASTLSTFRLAAPAEPTSATYASLTDPLCDLFIEVFELRDRNNWLRRQAINVLLRHIFGGAMERRVKDLIRSLVGESQLVGYITDIINTFWPHQRPFSAPMPRTPAQRKHTSSQVRQKLLFYLPYTLSSMVGRRNTEKGAERLFRITQHHLLNLHLALSIFDELIAELFPEIRRVQSSISAAATGNNLLYISPIQSPLLNPSIGSGGGRDPPTPIHRNRLNTL